MRHHHQKATMRQTTNKTTKLPKRMKRRTKSVWNNHLYRNQRPSLNPNTSRSTGIISRPPSCKTLQACSWYLKALWEILTCRCLSKELIKESSSHSRQKTFILEFTRLVVSILKLSQGSDTCSRQVHFKSRSKRSLDSDNAIYHPLLWLRMTQRR